MSGMPAMSEMNDEPAPNVVLNDDILGDDFLDDEDEDLDEEDFDDEDDE